MAYIAIDLGTTNIKAALFDTTLEQVSSYTETVHYNREDNNVEFDPSVYFDKVITVLRTCIEH